MRPSTCFVRAGLICAAIAGTVSAAGSIDTTGATLTTGTAPTQGSVKIDAAAPEGTAPDVPRLQPLGSIGTFTIEMPNQDLTDGGDTPYLAKDATTLGPGEYFFSTFDVEADSVVSFHGTVTIHTSGDVNVQGKMVCDGDTTLRFDCGADFTMGDGAMISTQTGRVVLDTDGDFTAGANAQVYVQQGDLTIRAHQAAVHDGDIRLSGSSIGGVAVKVLLQAEGLVSLTDGAGIGGTSDDIVVQAFGTDVTLANGSSIGATAAPDAIRIEAERSISVSGASATSPTSVWLTAGLIRMRAFGGGLDVTEGAHVTLTSGTIDLAARDDVRVKDTSLVRLTGGHVRLTSFERDVLIQPATATSMLDLSVGGTVADIELVAARHTVLNGGGRVRLTQGNLRFEAHGGDVTIGGGMEVGATGGRMEVLASGSITASNFTWHDDGVAWSAEGGTIDLDLGTTIHSGSGELGFVALAKGDLRLRGELRSSGEVRLASCDGSVDVAGLAAYTFASDGVASPSLFVESFAGDAGTIDVTGASLSTSNGSASSGDLSLLVHAGKTVPAEEGFMVPESIVTKRNARDARLSSITVGGYIDAGPDATLAGPATLTVGDRDIAVELVADRHGRLRAKGRGHDLRIVPARTGSSRASFRLKATSNPNGYLSKKGDGRATLRLRGASFDSSGNVTVAAGRYVSGRAAGSVSAPTIFPARCEMRPTDGGQDVFALVAGFAPDGTAPASAPDVRVTCGDGFVASIPGSAFGRAVDSVFTATAPVAGVRRAILDYVSGTLTVETSGIEVGTVPTTGSLTTVLGVSLANDQRAVRVRLGRARGRLQY